MKQERFLAFFDILGFKNLINEVDLNYLIERMEEYSDILKVSTRVPGVSEDCAKQEEKLLDYIVFSDSVVFYTESLEKHELARLVFVSKVFTYFSLLRGLPVRGCITHGEFYVNKNLFFGKALVDAYENGESQNWSGAFVLDKTIDYINKLYPDIMDFFLEKGFLIKYEVPFKLDDKVLKYVVNWANFNFDQKELQINNDGKIVAGFMLKDIANFSVENIDKEIRKDTTVMLNYGCYPDGVKEKINNTIQFFNFAKDINKSNFIKLVTP